MERLYQTAEQRKQVLEWLRSEPTLAAMAAKYAISAASISTMRRNVDGDFSALLKARVWHAIREWKRAKSGNPEPEQFDLPGMPPTRRSILLEMIQKELDAAGDDKLERFYKAIITA
jgi:hypothetical protein